MRNAILSLILAMLACLISSNIAVPANNTINANIAMPAKAIEGFTSPCVVRRPYFFVQCIRDSFEDRPGRKRLATRRYGQQAALTRPASRSISSFGTTPCRGSSRSATAIRGACRIGGGSASTQQWQCVLRPTIRSRRCTVSNRLSKQQTDGLLNALQTRSGRFIVTPDAFIVLTTTSRIRRGTR